jgi:hypothetical protein
VGLQPQQQHWQQQQHTVHLNQEQMLGARRSYSSSSSRASSMAELLQRQQQDQHLHLQVWTCMQSRRLVLYRKLLLGPAHPFQLLQLPLSFLLQKDLRPPPKAQELPLLVVVVVLRLAQILVQLVLLPLLVRRIVVLLMQLALRLVVASALLLGSIRHVRHTCRNQRQQGNCGVYMLRMMARRTT